MLDEARDAGKECARRVTRFSGNSKYVNRMYPRSSRVRSCNNQRSDPHNNWGSIRADLVESARSFDSSSSIDSIDYFDICSDSRPSARHIRSIAFLFVTSILSERLDAPRTDCQFTKHFSAFAMPLKDWNHTRYQMFAVCFARKN